MFELLVHAHNLRQSLVADNIGGTQEACTVSTPDGRGWKSMACTPNSPTPYIVNNCLADGVELQKKHKPVTVSYQGYTVVNGDGSNTGYSGVGSNIFICGTNGWVSTS